MGGSEEWPLVGRDVEIRTAEELLRTRERGVVIAGPAGVGKTRLAGEYLRMAREQGFVCLRALATRVASGLPFGAFASLLPTVDPGLDRADMLREVARAIAGQGGGQPIALLVDDAQLLDDSSAALAHQLLAAGDVFLVATVRAGDPAPDAIIALWKDGLAERQELRPLTESDVDALLREALGGPVEGSTRHLLFERSAGNVLFLREMVLGAREAGVLRDDGGVWQLHARLSPSARLVEIVESRLAGLAEQAREAMELVAIAESGGVELFERLVGQGNVASLDRRGLVRVEQDGRRLELSLAHPVYGEVLRALISPLRVRSIYRSLADGLEDTGRRRRDDLLRVSAWRLQGGGPAHPATMFEAAQRAFELHDMDLAERLVVAAADAGAGFRAGLLLAQILIATGRAEEAEAHLAALDTTGLADGDRARLAFIRADNLCYSLGRLDDALAVAERAEAAIADPAGADEITAYRATILDVSGKTSEALAIASPLLERATGRALVWASVQATWALARTGRVTEAIEVSERGEAARQMLTGTPLPWDESSHVSTRVLALALAGRLQEATEMAAAEYERAISEGSVDGRFLMSAVLAVTCAARGQVASAIRWAREAIASAQAHGRLIILRVAVPPLAESLALSGDTAGARKVLEGLAALPTFKMSAAELTRARAWVALVEDRKAAIELLEEAAAIARAAGELVWESAALHDLARLGLAGQVADRLADLAGVVEGPMACTRAAHARALVVGDPAELAAASSAFERMGALLLAAEAAADAATAWRRDGEPRKANALQRRVAQLADQCEGASTPALAVTSEVRAALAGRTLEIAMLAARGLSNREIADQLYLSVHTVENKLHVAYEKLGIRSRAELADALGTR